MNKTATDLPFADFKGLVDVMNTANLSLSNSPKSAGCLHHGFFKPKLVDEFVVAQFLNKTLGGSLLYIPMGTSSADNHEMVP